MRPSIKLFFLLSAFLSFTVVYAQSTTDSIRNIKIDALVGLQFDLIRFVVKPGEKLNLVLTIVTT